MSEFHVTVVRLTDVQKHPNADSLYIAKIHGGYPVIFKGKEHGGSFQKGDLAVYIPVDSIVPATKEFAWLSPMVELLLPGGEKQMVEPEVPREKDRRVRAKRLRGVFSMGMLSPAPEGTVEGQDVAELVGITKYEEPEEIISASRTDGLQVPAPRLAATPSVYDIEGLRRYTKAFMPFEKYVVTEKLHGQNARFVHDGEKLHVGSRTRWLTTEERNTWADAATRYRLAEKLATASHMVYFFLQSVRSPGMSVPECTRSPLFYILYPFMLIVAAVLIPLCMFLSLGDLTEEPNNHLVVVRKKKS